MFVVGSYNKTADTRIGLQTNWNMDRFHEQFDARLAVSTIAVTILHNTQTNYIHRWITQKIGQPICVSYKRSMGVVNKLYIAGRRNCNSNNLVVLWTQESYLQKSLAKNLTTRTIVMAIACARVSKAAMALTGTDHHQNTAASQGVQEVPKTKHEHIVILRVPFPFHFISKH